MMGHKAILHIYSTFNNVLITARFNWCRDGLQGVGGMVTKE